MFVSEFLEDGGTTTAFARRSRSIARELAALGNEVQLVTAESSGTTASVLEVKTVRLSRTDPPQTWVGRAAKAFRISGAFARILGAEKPNAVVVSFHDPLQGLLLVLTARSSGFPVVFDAQDSWLVLEHEHVGQLQNAVRKRIERKAMRLSQRVTTVTPTLKEWLARAYGLAPAKIGVVYNGADLPGRMPAPPKDIDIIHLGSPRPYYNTLEVLSALADVKRRLPSLNVVFLGCTSEPYVNRVRERAAEMGLSDNVKFMPPIPSESVGAWLLRAKVALHTIVTMPIYRCAIGVKVFEYLAYGLPIAHMGLPDGETAGLIRGNGCGVVAGAPSMLASALFDIITDDQRRLRMGDAARTASLRYSWRESAHSMAAALSEAQGE